MDTVESSAISGSYLMLGYLLISGKCVMRDERTAGTRALRRCSCLLGHISSNKRPGIQDDIYPAAKETDLLYKTKFRKEYRAPALFPDDAHLI